jgi:hypothetical protein
MSKIQPESKKQEKTDWCQITLDKDDISLLSDMLQIFENNGDDTYYNAVSSKKSSLEKFHKIVGW